MVQSCCWMTLCAGKLQWWGDAASTTLNVIYQSMPSIWNHQPMPIELNFSFVCVSWITTTEMSTLTRIVFFFIWFRFFSFLFVCVCEFDQQVEIGKLSKTPISTHCKVGNTWTHNKWATPRNIFKWLRGISTSRKRETVRERVWVWESVWFEIERAINWKRW